MPRKKKKNKVPLEPIGLCGQLFFAKDVVDFFLYLALHLGKEGGVQNGPVKSVRDGLGAGDKQVLDY